MHGMKLPAVLSRVSPEDPDRDRIRRVVLETIAALGLDVARDGEVYNPAGDTAWKPPAQSNVRFTGSRRK